MTKSESVTSSETCEKLAQLLEQSIAYSNRITTQLAFYTESTIIGYRDQITGTYISLLLLTHNTLTRETRQCEGPLPATQG